MVYLFIFATEPHCVKQASLDLLPYPPLECWDYKRGPLCSDLSFILFKHTSYVCVHMCIPACTGTTVCMWKSEGSSPPHGPQVLNSGSQAW